MRVDTQRSIRFTAVGLYEVVDALKEAQRLAPHERIWIEIANSTAGASNKYDVYINWSE